MISKGTYNTVKAKALELFDKAHIVLTQKERDNIEIADMGLNDIDKFGLQLVIYINSERVCSKEMALMPYQTCPEHRHPPLSSTNPGKQETFRCRYGLVYLYVDGPETSPIKAKLPGGKDEFTAFHEIVLHPGEQFTIMPNTRHWFQAGADGAVISEFSTQSLDDTDIFTDKRVARTPEIG